MFQALILLFLLLICLPASADLADRFSALTKPHGLKVGVAFIDLKSGQELTINGTAEFPTASVGKIPVMAAAYALAEKGEINLETKVPYRPQDKLGGSGILQWTKFGRYYSLRRLISLMITRSDNTATKMVINNVGLDKIGQFLETRGFSNIVIADPTMLREPPLKNRNLATPLEMAHLVGRIEKRDGFSEASAAEMLKYMSNQVYRWGLWQGVPPGTKIADKTGNLTSILNDVGIVYTRSGNYVLAIFTNGFTMKKNARLLVNKLSQAAYEEYTGEKVVFPKPVKKKIITKKRWPKKRVYRKTRTTKRR
ncbi:MAG: class A beta-lactamase-related serine hydrolase [Candidatus Margulisbacteria bacterium]|nr:class A beta-lactamase-related serine hydrolase [Candidatus Margulisiibacteriota bacterium]